MKAKFAAQMKHQNLSSENLAAREVTVDYTSSRMFLFLLFW